MALSTLALDLVTVGTSTVELRRPWALLSEHRAASGAVL